ncbi:MAG: hypothetical protein AAF617_05910 [Bacteroidota bacterium]
MKKVTIKLSLHKQKVSSFKNNTVKGGATGGTTCKYTNKYYQTCLPGCVPPDPSVNCHTNFPACPSGNSYPYCHR